MADSDHDWPDTDEFESMTDSELLDHAIEVREAKAEVLPADSRSDGMFGYLCDLRREHIRDVLKARSANRQNGLGTDPDLDDLDGDLEGILFGDRAPTST
jgi:hypothetical protein